MRFTGLLRALATVCFFLPVHEKIMKVVILMRIYKLTKLSPCDCQESKIDIMYCWIGRSMFGMLDIVGRAG